MMQPAPPSVGFPAKPAYGAACNGCGLCCTATPCGLAMALVAGAQKGQPCPALEWEDGRSWCGLVRHPYTHARGLKGMRPEADLGTMFAEDLGGVGTGCDSGPPYGGGFDELVGMTAAEYLVAPIDKEEYE
jgi:hypothetical protein